MTEENLESSKPEPTPSKPLPKFGHYRTIRSLGKGGMGEVFLVHDPLCGRFVALKHMREDIKKNETLQKRFIREARVASQLSHPAIIPIYAIHHEESGFYYTMPYVQGETLTEIFALARHAEKQGLPLHPIGGSIPALIRIFITVCQAIAYSHVKGILHRDLKPGNIIVGKYGEVLILDWGTAAFIDEPEEENVLDSGDFTDTHLTRPGGIIGTIPFLAPELIFGEPPSPSSDIYALGVILYQILTLHLPFKRGSVKGLRKEVRQEKLLDPTEMAPYRDIPRHLSDIAKKCLAVSKEERYQTVEQITKELECYSEGRPEWIFSAKLAIENKEDWEFQENILLAKHIAITRGTDVMEWVSMMISKASFSGNIKLEAKISVAPSGNGIGFLFNIPEAEERKGLEDGYCLWIGSSTHPGCKLYRSNVEEMDIPHVKLQDEVWHQICIEKIDNTFRFFLDGVLKLNYVSHTPLAGTHIGLLYRDGDFQIQDLSLFVGSQNVMVNCLAVPDAFLANKNFSKALSEYRRIGYSFPGRAEGRDALFRAGVTLLEEASFNKKKSEKKRLFILAFEEFGKLRGTPGAPLEYLGKSLIYKTTGDIEEENKCLELAIRKYPKHPLLPILVEHIVFRLHESSSHDRRAAYNFALLALRHLPQIFHNLDNQRLIESLIKHWEPLPFIEQLPADSPLLNTHLAIQLAFWLAKPIPILEIIDQLTIGSKKTEEESAEEKEEKKEISPEANTLLENALFSLLMLRCFRWARERVGVVSNAGQIEIALLVKERSLKFALKEFFRSGTLPTLSFSELRTLFYLFTEGLIQQKSALILPYFSRITHDSLSPQERLLIDVPHVWALLLEKEWERAEEILKQYPLETLNQESSPLHFLFGCWLLATEGKEIALIHFSGVQERAYPPTWSLLSHYLLGKIDLKKGWITKAFFWEKIELFRQLILFYHCAEEPKNVTFFQKKLRKELLHVASLHPTA